MFERMTDRARRVVTLTQEEARLLDHNYLGTEHILLGLLHEEHGIAAQVLAKHFTLQEMRDTVEKIIGKGPGSATGHIPFTPRAKRVFELSLREALQLGHNYIGTEHILLGLIREGEGVAARIIEQRVKPAQLRQEIIEILSERLASTKSKPTAPAGVKRWEYRVVELVNGLGKLNEAGTHGWEAVTIDNGFALCKRQKVN